MHRRAISLVVLTGVLGLSGGLLVAQAPRKSIKSVSDLPAFSYSIIGSQDDLIRSEDVFHPLAGKLRRDVESLLRDYTIEDRATRRNLHFTLLTLDLLENRTAEARKEVAIVRDLEDKPLFKLTDVLFQEALLDSGWPKRDPEEFLRRFSAALNRLPWDVVAERIKARKANLEKTAPANRNSPVDTPSAPTVQKTQQVDLSTARTIANSRYQLAIETPLKDQAIEAFAAYIAAHKDAPPTPDIWPARSVTLHAGDEAKPVVIGIWDSGVDRSLFRGQLATDGPVPGFDIYGNPTEGELLAVGTPFRGHGTNVTGIALEGNPFGRLVVVRGEHPAPPPWKVPPPPPTLSGIRKFAAGLSQLTAYLRKQGARVVNFSGGGFYDRFEQMLQANGAGADAVERRKMAQEMRVTVRDGMRAALASTPEILYVVAAGNDNSDMTFNETLWASVNELPNLIVVGAVNQAGSQTDITNFGPAVTVYANGWQVETCGLGGKRVKFSGTSAAAPNVTNLAAKLIALDSSLTPADVVKLIRDGSDLSADGRFRLINPKRSVALLQARTRSSATAQPSTSEPFYPAGFDAAMLTRLVDTHLADARAAAERLVGARGRRTAANTLRPFDDAINATQLAEGLAAIAAQLHPDAAIRAEGLRARERISRFRAEFATDPRVAEAFAALDTTALTREERLLVARIRRDCHRAGADRDAATRARFRVLFETHDRLTVEFVRNIEDSKVPAASYRKGWPANGAVLDSLLRTREEIAHLAGSRDWASYQAETQMAGSADAIRAFLDQIRSASEPARKRSTARYLERARREDPSTTRLRLSQVSPAGNLIRREQYGFDQVDVRAYFPFERVKKGVLSIVGEFFGVEFRPVDIPVWHPSVEAYEVRDHGRLIGRVYLDLHPRPEKTPNGLGRALPVRGGIKERQLPEAILIAPLPGGQPGDPGLNVGQIAMFFHEFGHVMNHLLSVRPYVSTGGFPDEVDFLEVPSLMLEEFTQQPALLRRLSGHVQTGAPIPDDLLKRMHDAQQFSRPIGVGQTTAMAAVSLQLHDRPADAADPDGLARRAFASDMDVDLDPEMHFPASFAFLALHADSIDYSSNYYTFLWSPVIVEDLWSVFDPANPLEPGTARRYVDTILRPGKSRPPAESVRAFLGRPFNLTSWQRWLEGDERR